MARFFFLIFLNVAGGGAFFQHFSGGAAGGGDFCPHFFGRSPAAAGSFRIFFWRSLEAAHFSRIFLRGSPAVVVYFFAFFVGCRPGRRVLS